MKQEYKELLLRDLCARLPYGVECFVHGDCDSTLTSIVNDRCYFENLDWEMEEDDGYRDIDSGRVQPYLRPMSSMTEEEKQELLKVTLLIGYDEYCETLKSFDFYGDARLDVGMEIWLKAFDWLDKKMFAYRTYNDKNMFELGLAIPAPEGMYK